MSENKKGKINIAEEQLEALAASLYPVIKEFYKTERGKQVFNDYLREKSKKRDGAA